MKQLIADVRDTIHTNSAELRYADPRTLQVYQGTFLVAIAMSLLAHDFSVMFDLVGSPPWHVGGVFAQWRDRNIWSAFAGLLGFAILASRSYTHSTRLLLFIAAMFWFAFTCRVFILIGFLPLSSGLTTLLAVHAALGYWKLRSIVEGGA